jgi:hypothetical protein
VSICSISGTTLELEGETQPVDKTGHTAERQQAASEQPTAALLLAAFAAAATVAANGDSSHEASDGEPASGDCAAISWLDSLHANLRSDKKE